MLTLSTRQAYSEIDEFLEIIDEESRNKVPEKLRDFFKKEKDTNYIKNIDLNVPIEQQKFKKETLALIAYLNLQYWCEDEEEKKNLMRKYKENEEQVKKETREKLNGLNKKEETNNDTETVKEASLVEVKKGGFFKNIIDKLKKILQK